MSGEYEEGRFNVEGLEGGIRGVDQENAPWYRAVEQKEMRDYLPGHLQGGSPDHKYKEPEPPARPEIRF
jgi:hypothetical protein